MGLSKEVIPSENQKKTKTKTMCMSNFGTSIVVRSLHACTSEVSAT